MEASNKWFRFLSGTLAGASFVATTQIVTKTDVVGMLFIAVCCFSISLPFLVACFFRPPSSWTPSPDKAASTPLNWRYAGAFMAFIISIAICLIGIMCIFWNFHWILGILFLLSTLSGIGHIYFSSEKLTRL
jgi:hypothetical protein